MPFLDLLAYLGTWLYVEHRLSVTPRHRTLFWANLAARVQFVRCCLSSAQCLASSCCEAGLSSSFLAGSRSGLDVWCWMLASCGCVRSSPFPLQNLFCYWFLSRSLPQFFIWDHLWPSDVVDAPQIGVEECLDFL